MKRHLKRAAKMTPIYPIYKSVVDGFRWRRLRRDFWHWTEDDRRRLEFYRPFIDPGSTVFDVGANVGNRTKIFSKLAAVVVAVEPQRPCASFLESVFRERNVTVVRAALGSKVGNAELRVSNAHAISSLSDEWIAAVRNSGRFEEYEWSRSEVVPVDTLDNLIEQYGPPAFVKIDVEGFEDRVVAGLSTPVRALSIEFTPEFMEGTRAAIEHLCAIGAPRFQISLGESMEFSLPDWVGADGVLRELARVPAASFGDVYALESGR
jgi:FkbM family methyltransferase